MPFLKQRINTIIGLVFLASFGLGATFVIINIADPDNSLAEAMVARITLPEE